jgi:hypothetical protein
MGTVKFKTTIGIVKADDVPDPNGGEVGLAADNYDHLIIATSSGDRKQVLDGDLLPVAVEHGGTGRTDLGAAGQCLTVNEDGTALQYQSKLDQQRSYPAAGTTSTFFHGVDGGGYMVEDSNDNSLCSLGCNADPHSPLKVETRAINQDTQVGTRLLQTLDAIYYTAGQNTATYSPAQEIATAAHIPTSLSQLTNDGHYVVDAAYVHTDSNYTAAEKSKLAGINDDHFKGSYPTLEDLQAAHPTASDGDYAYVGTAGQDAVNYIWDGSDEQWVAGGGGTAETPASVKQKYESNGDTNAYDDAAVNIVATVGDVENLTTATKTTLVSAVNELNATFSNYVPSSRTVNGKPLSANITLANSDIGSEPAYEPGTAAQYLRGDKSWQDLAAAARSAVLTGLSTSSYAQIAATDSILAALGKLQGQINHDDWHYVDLSTPAGTKDTSTHVIRCWLAKVDVINSFYQKGIAEIQVEVRNVLGQTASIRINQGYDLSIGSPYTTQQQCFANVQGNIAKDAMQCGYRAYGDLQDIWLSINDMFDDDDNMGSMAWRVNYATPGTDILVANTPYYSIGSSYTPYTNTYSSLLPIATTSTIGAIRPDGTSISVDAYTGVASVISSGGGGDMVMLADAQLTADASYITFQGLFDGAAYRGYLLYFDKVLPTTNGAQLLLQFRTGASSHTLTTDYAFFHSVTNNTSTSSEHLQDKAVNLTMNGLSSKSAASDANGCHGYVYITSTNTTAFKTRVVGMATGWNSASSVGQYQYGGGLYTIYNIDGCRLLFSSGSIAAGSGCTLYGLKR